MTGEITLRGRILPIGGVKEKLLAAHRAGITHVLLPTDNEKDLEEIPASVLGKMQITLVEHMDEVLSHALYAEPVNDQPLPFMVPPMDQPVSDESWMGEQ